MKFITGLILGLASVPGSLKLNTNNFDARPRVIVLSDIEADPNDTQSFVRLLLYANEIDIQGILTTTSCWHQNSVEPESIVKVIRAFGKAHPKLLQHDPGYPGEEVLEQEDDRLLWIVLHSESRR